MSWRLTIETVPPIGARFMVLFADGSGGRVFLRGDGGALIDEEGDFLFDEALSDEELLDFMLEAQYLFWTLLPEDFPLWFEQGTAR